MLYILNLVSASASRNSSCRMVFYLEYIRIGKYCQFRSPAAACFRLSVAGFLLPASRFLFQFSSEGRISASAEAASCPGAEARPAVAKVTQEPSKDPASRLMLPKVLMDIVI